MNPSLKGYLFAAMAAASYGTNPVFAKPCYADGMNADSVLLFRYLSGLLLLILMMLYNQNRKVVAGRAASLWSVFSLEQAASRRSYAELLVMGVLMAISSVTLFLSYNYMPVGIASTLLFTYPMLVAIIMALFYGERLSKFIILCLVLACGGVGLLCPFDFRESVGLPSMFVIGLLLVFLSSLSYAIYLVGLNKSRLRTIASMPVTFYVLVFGTLFFVVRLLLFSAFILPHNPWMWLNLLALGFFPTVVSLLCTAKAIQCIGSTRTALFGALEPVTAVLLGLLILGEKVSTVESIGMLLILVSVTLVMKRK